MSHLRKFLVALVGVGVTWLGRRYGYDSAVFVDVVGILTALGVYSVPNG